jgi:hypothetical protein
MTSYDHLYRDLLMLCIGASGLGLRAPSSRYPHHTD